MKIKAFFISLFAHLFIFGGMGLVLNKFVRVSTPYQNTNISVSLKNNKETKKPSMKKKVKKAFIQEKSKKEIRPHQEKKISSSALKPAKSLVHLEPHYPERARLMELEGRVTIAFTVSDKGDVTKTSVVKSTGYDILDREAIRTLKEASFRPAMENGVAIKSQQQMTFKFGLRE